MSLIDVENVTFSYAMPGEASRVVLKDVSLKIEEGEWIALVGSNGSGKTTLARHLNGLLKPTSGRVLVRGADTREASSRRTIHSTVGMVFQFPEDQIVSTVVQEDTAFGPENLNLPAAEIQKRVEEALRQVGMWEQRMRPPHLLSAGQMQRLALAGVLAMRPKCIIFDEATTMLDPAGRKMVMEAMRQLNREGVAIIFVTHFMEEAAVADRVLVMHHGQLVRDANPAQIFADAAFLAEMGLEQPAGAAFARRVRPTFPQLPDSILTVDDLLAAFPPCAGALPAVMGAWRPTCKDAVKAIEVEDLGHVYMQGTPMAHRALEHAGFAAVKGQCTGLAGATGSGKSTLLQHLNGLLRPQEGRVRIGSFDLTDPKLERKSVTRISGLVFQNPENQFFEQYVGDEVAYGPRQFGCDEPLAQRVRWAMETAGLDFDHFKDRLLFTLSGGERRKVALASILAARPEILLLDEPTAGLDPAARRELHRRLRGLQQNGMTMVISSHQMEDLAALCSCMAVYQDGHDAMSGPVEQIFAQPERLADCMLEQPVSARILSGLRAKGWNLPEGLLDADQIADGLITLGGGKSLE